MTTIRVLVRNGSERALLVRYADFAILDREGSAYVALPPRAAASPPSALYVVREARFRSERFAVASYLASSYPTLPVWAGPYSHDRAAEDAAFRLWPRGLPTDRTRSWELPAGVLEAGGELEGRLYFTRVPLDLERALFVARIESVNPGPVAEHRLPLDLAR